MFVEFLTYVYCMKNNIEKLKNRTYTDKSRTRLTMAHIQVIVLMLFVTFEMYQDAKITIFYIWCGLTLLEVYLLIKHLKQKRPTN